MDRYLLLLATVNLVPTSTYEEVAVFAGELMTRKVVTVGPDATVKAAVQQLNRHSITSMPVVDDDNRLVGVVSEADLLRGDVFDDEPAHRHARPLA